MPVAAWITLYRAAVLYTGYQDPTLALLGVDPVRIKMTSLFQSGGSYANSPPSAATTDDLGPLTANGDGLLFSDGQIVFQHVGPSYDLTTRMYMSRTFNDNGWVYLALYFRFMNPVGLTNPYSMTFTFRDDPEATEYTAQQLVIVRDLVNNTVKFVRSTRTRDSQGSFTTAELRETAEFPAGDSDVYRAESDHGEIWITRVYPTYAYLYGETLIETNGYLDNVTCSNPHPPTGSRVAGTGLDLLSFSEVTF